MVYCGRPSKGCHACRERKSRCDKLPEGCTQCKRARRECPGYRQLGDVIFRNESEKVVRKAKAKEARNKAKREQADAVAVVRAPPLAPGQAVGREMHSQAFDLLNASYRGNLTNLIMLPPIEDMADGFFVSGFVSRVDGESGPGRFDYILGDYRELTADEGLQHSMRAVGFASYATTSKSPDLLKKARVQYTQAIKLTNRALASLDLAKKDTTLLSILVLGIFETITGTEQKSLKHWSQHINGAAAVIALRGKEQIKTVAGRRMVFQVTSNLLITCLARGEPLPDFIVKYADAAVDMIENPDPALHVQRTMMRAAQLRAEVLSGVCKDLQAILDKALELDSALLAISENPPDGWVYETVYTDVETSYVWKGKYHVYRDCWASQLWNSLRTIRVILNELIRNVLLRGFASKPSLFPHATHTAQLQHSTSILYTLQADILSSVPQHLFALPSPATIQKEALAAHAKVNAQATVSSVALSRGQKDSQERLELALLTNQPLGEAVVESLLPATRTAPGNEQLTLPLHTRPAQPSSQTQHSTSHPSPPKTPSSSTTQIHISIPSPFNSPFAHPRKPTAASRTYGGNFLMWPLWFAGVMDIATDEVRAFAVRNLKDVGKELGIKQGWVLAELLEKRMLMGV